MGRIVGIDLGTTNSLVAYLDPQTNQPKCISGPYGSTLCPSVVSLDADGTIVVGEAARRRLLTQPERTIYSVKRLMGRGPADVQDEVKLFPFRIDPSSKNVIRIKLGDKVFTPPEISAFILRELKNWAEAHSASPFNPLASTFPRNFMMLSAKLPRTPVKLPASKFSASSTNQLPRPSPTACTKSSAAKSLSTISAAAPLTFPSSSSSPPPKATFSRFFPPTATRTWVATTSTIFSRLLSMRRFSSTTKLTFRRIANSRKSFAKNSSR